MPKRLIIIKDSTDHDKDIFDDIDRYIEEQSKFKYMFDHISMDRTFVFNNDSFTGGEGFLNILHPLCDPKQFRNEIMPHRSFHVDELIENMDIHGTIYFLSTDVPVKMSDVELLNSCDYARTNKHGVFTGLEDDIELSSSDKTTHVILLWAGHKIGDLPIYVLILNNFFLIDRNPKKIENDHTIVRSLRSGEYVKDMIFSMKGEEGVDALIGDKTIFTKSNEISLVIWSDLVKSMSNYKDFDVSKMVKVTTNLPYKIDRNQYFTIDTTGMKKGDTAYFSVRFVVDDFFSEWVHPTQRFQFEYTIHRN